MYNKEKRWSLLVLIFSLNVYCQMTPVQLHLLKNDVLWKLSMNKNVPKKDIQLLLNTNTIPFSRLNEIAYLYLKINKKISFELLKKSSSFGVLSKTKLSEPSIKAILGEKKIKEIIDVYLDSITPELFTLYSEVTEKLAIENYFRWQWVRKRDTLALAQFQKLDSANFIFVDDLIQKGKFPYRQELFIEDKLFALFLHTTSEMFGNDSVAFEHYRAKIHDLVLKGKFNPDEYALWVDRFHKFNLSSDDEIYGTFRSFDTKSDEIPEVLEPERIDELRKEIGVKSVQQELDIRLEKEKSAKNDNN